MRLVVGFMSAEGYLVSPKSIFEPTSLVPWLQKDVDVQELSISKSVVLMAKVLIALVLAWGETVQVKTVMQILGLIGWCATRGRGHLRFLGSVYGAVFWNQSSFITV